MTWLWFRFFFTFGRSASVAYRVPRTPAPSRSALINRIFRFTIQSDVPVASTNRIISYYWMSVHAKRCRVDTTVSDDTPRSPVRHDPPSCYGPRCRVSVYLPIGRSAFAIITLFVRWTHGACYYYYSSAERSANRVIIVVRDARGGFFREASKNVFRGAKKTFWEVLGKYDTFYFLRIQSNMYFSNNPTVTVFHGSITPTKLIQKRMKKIGRVQHAYGHVRPRRVVLKRLCAYRVNTFIARQICSIN